MEPYRDFALYYDRLMAGRYNRAWWRVFSRLLKARGLARDVVADLAAGTGEAGRRFLRPGARVYLVDRSAAMLERAARRAPGARLLRQDLRRLSLPEPVDLAVSVFGGVNYLAGERDLVRVFRRVRSALKPGGAFALDAVTPHHLRVNFGRGTEWFEGPGFVSVWRYAWEPERASSLIRVDGFTRTGTAWTRHRPEAHRHHAYPLPVLKRALRAAGFGVCEAFGLPHGEAPRARDTHWLLLARPG